MGRLLDKIVSVKLHAQNTDAAGNTQGGFGRKNERGMNEWKTSALYIKKERTNARPPWDVANIRVNPGGWPLLCASRVFLFWGIPPAYSRRAGIPGVAGRLGVPAKTFLGGKGQIFFRA